jgi:hypothetical protein
MVRRVILRHTHLWREELIPHTFEIIYLLFWTVRMISGTHSDSGWSQGSDRVMSWKVEFCPAAQALWISWRIGRHDHFELTS